MKRRKMLAGALIAGCLGFTGTLQGCDGGASVPDPGYDPEAPTDAAVQSNNALALQMYRQLAAEGDEADNLLFSPTSISAALMLTYEGSRNQTQAEFETVLSLDGEDRVAAHQAYAGMLGRLSGEKKPYELTVANALWGEQTMPFRNEFIETLRAHYAASFESVDFKNDFENQRKRINGWVEERTNERIKDLLPEDSLDDMTRLVLANAIYFKAKWAVEFEEYATRDTVFHLTLNPDAGAKTVEVPMMRLSMEWLGHADFDGYDALQLHYKSRDLSMVVLLPDKKDGLPALEKKLSPALIDETVTGLEAKPVNLWLPKWETTRDYDLIPALKAMGMKGAFKAATADFTGVSDSAEADDLYISGVFHKAFIAVDEVGTEAAAATAVVLAEESAAFADKPVEFRADHPFVYLIRDNRTGAILFMGRVTNPASGS